MRQTYNVQHNQTYHFRGLQTTFKIHIIDYLRFTNKTTEKYFSQISYVADKQHYKNELFKMESFYAQVGLKLQTEKEVYTSIRYFQ